MQLLTAYLKHGSHGHMLRQRAIFRHDNIPEEGCYAEGHFSEIRILFAVHRVPETYIDYT
jgi:hypothetical protein